MNPPVVLMWIDDPDLSASADRVVAAVGARAVRIGAPTNRAWLAASAVLVDESAANRCAIAGMPRREGVLLIGPEDPPARIWAAAVQIGAQHVCALPAGEAELVGHLAEATDTGVAGGRRGRVVAVTAGHGGGGASVFCVALAQGARDALLLDLDPYGGGIELLVGGETEPGLRWPDLSLQGGRLGWASLRDALPRRDGLSFLSGTRIFHEIDAGAAGAVVDAGRRAGLTVVCDVPRQPGSAAIRAIQCADLVAVITRCDVRGTAATTVVAGAVRTLNPAVGLVVRGPAPGGLQATEVAEAVGAPLLVAMRPEPALAARLEQGGIRLGNRSPLSRAARTVLGALDRNVGGRSA